MNRVLGLTLALMVCLAPSAWAQDEMKTSSYYPLEVGNTWTYQVMGNPITMKVEKHEKVGDVMTAKIITEVSGQTVASENVAVQDDGIYRYAINGQQPESPAKFLALPPEADATWEVKTKIQNQDITGSFVLKSEKITVGETEYDTILADGQNFQIAGQKTSIKYWFAEGVGIVKLSFSLDGQDAVLELQEFTPAAAPAPPGE